LRTIHALFPARLLRTFLLRGICFWFLARLMGMAVLAGGSTNESSGLLLSIWVVVMTASVTLIDLHRRREVALLHNLGITITGTVGVATFPAVIIEAGLVMLVS
jgi:hypothetical protein